MKNQKMLTLWGLWIAVALTALALTSATFAWFTANREVGTARVSARTGSGSFVYNPITQDGYAESFLPTQDESLYYHDTIYLRALGDGMAQDTKMALYLDNTDKPVVESSEGELLTAARLGLTFDGASPVIIALSDVNEGVGNTRPGGVLLGDGQVLSYTNGTVTPVNDPAISLADAQITVGTAVGKTPIATLELNRVYTVDVYFYLEGCDPDCTSEKVGLDQAALNLAFYGLLAD